MVFVFTIYLPFLVFFISSSKSGISSGIISPLSQRTSFSICYCIGLLASNCTHFHYLKIWLFHFYIYKRYFCWIQNYTWTYFPLKET